MRVHPWRTAFVVDLVDPTRRVRREKGADEENSVAAVVA